MRILIRPATSPRTERVRIAAANVVVKARPQRVLDFDIEARPLSFIGGDYVSKEITAMSWCWTDRPDQVQCLLLGETDPIEMLRAFTDVYSRADLVTGHYIRGFDIPTITGALMEYRLPLLPDKATHDTKIDLVRSSGISLSQESLGAMLHLDEKKEQMNQTKWRMANRLTPEGRAEARRRCTGDVKQHMALRRELCALGYLSAPKMWRSGAMDPLPAYTP